MLSKQILPLQFIPIEENGITVLEHILMDVIADLHALNLAPPGIVLIDLGTDVDGDEDHPLRRLNHLIGDEPFWRTASSAPSTTGCRMERARPVIWVLVEERGRGFDHRGLSDFLYSPASAIPGETFRIISY